jgi:hypothetical protein
VYAFAHICTCVAHKCVCVSICVSLCKATSLSVRLCARVSCQNPTTTHRALAGGLTVRCILFHLHKAGTSSATLPLRCICGLLFEIQFAIYHLLSAVCYLLSAVCCLLSDICYLLSSVCRLLSAAQGLRELGDPPVAVQT